MTQNTTSDSDPASWAALVIAVIAMMIAFIQVSQQYASSGQLIRLCDSVVYGGKAGLPGRGRRVWTWSQLRFRVLYEVPVFCFPVSRNPPWMAPPVSSAQISVHGFLSYRDTSAMSSNERYWAKLSPTHEVGEASWVSFCRKIKNPCVDRVLITLKNDDADRCPPDLPNVPVPIRLRDVIIMAFAIGLDCIEASLKARSLSMQGPVGSLTSSNHPIVGPVIHFAPRSQEQATSQPKFWSNWAARVYGHVPVAMETLSASGRRGTRYFENSDPLLRKLRCILRDLPRHVPEAKRFDRESWVFSEMEAENVELEAQTAEKEDLSELKRFGSKSDTVVDRQPGLVHQLSPPSQFDIAIEWGSHINWYWLSQMNVFEGHFASPWKENIEFPVCTRAFNIVLSALASEQDVGWGMVRFPGRDINNLFADGLPFFTHPPYAKVLARFPDTNVVNMNCTGWQYFTAFGTKLPLVIVLADGDFRGDMQAISNIDFGHTDTQFFVMELMRLDYWLCRASETEAIINGSSNMLKNTPALVEYFLQSFYHIFRECYVDGLDQRMCIDVIQIRLGKLGLSGAERIFLLVAVLRTLRYAFCIGIGLNSRPALDILMNDLPAHMV